MSVLKAICLAAVLLAHAGGVCAQVAISPAATLQLAGGKLDLGGTGLQIGGNVSVGAGSITNARDVSIAAGGVLDAGSGTIGLSGNWSDLGNFVAGTSTVNFIDGGLAQSIVSGATAFYAASFVSNTGKNYVFPVGLTQTFANALTILGNAAPIQFRSATPGQVANVNLAFGGTQNIHNVGVSNVHAIGQQLDPAETNQGGSGDAIGWFGALAAFVAVPAPMLSLLGLLLLAMAMTAAAFATRLRNFAKA